MSDEALIRTLSVPRTERVEFRRVGQISEAGRTGDRMGLALEMRPQAAPRFESGLTLFVSSDSAGDHRRGVSVSLWAAETYHIAVEATWAPSICRGDWLWLEEK